MGVAITRDTLRLARQLRRTVGIEADNTVRALTRAWAGEWEQLEPRWQTAAVDLAVLAVELGEWPQPAEIGRQPPVLAALAATGDALDRLAALTRTTATEAADRAIDVAVELEPRVIASQAPATQREGLHTLVSARVAEQEPSLIVRIIARIRSAAINLIRARAAQQIVSDTIPLSQDAQDAVARELVAGVDTGDNPRTTARKIVKAVAGAFNGGLTRALNISRTEVLDAYRQASQQVHTANSDLVEGWQWMAQLDRRCCPSCWAMHGTVHPVTSPGPWDHQQGRCARLPVLVPWSRLGIKAPEPDDLMPDAQTVFWGLPEEDQLAIMGPGRLELLRTGAVDWADLSTQRQNPGWRPSHVPTPVRDLQTRAA